MQNIDKKVTLILNLNKKLKRIDFFVEQNNYPPINILNKKTIQKQQSKSLLIFSVLTNLNYLNY